MAVLVVDVLMVVMHGLMVVRVWIEDGVQMENLTLFHWRMGRLWVMETGRGVTEISWEVTEISWEVMEFSLKVREERRDAEEDVAGVGVEL